MFSATDASQRKMCCGTYPTSRRHSGIFASTSSSSSIQIVPPVGTKKPRRRSTSVVFPDPVAPTSPQSDRAGISRVRSCRTGPRSSLYENVTFSSRMDRSGASDRGCLARVPDAAAGRNRRGWIERSARSSSRGAALKRASASEPKISWAAGINRFAPKA